MYYESIQHRTVECANAEEAAMKIRKGNVCSCDALVWRSSVDGQRLAAVGDGGLDSPFAEVAVINLDTGIQIESITFAWIKDDSEAVKYLKECETDPCPLGKARLPLDGCGEDQKTTLTCGCCGEGFKSTIAEQRPFDQDEGYGYCPRCISRYNLKAA